jgi:hypothetical protein
MPSESGRTTVFALSTSTAARKSSIRPTASRTAASVALQSRMSSASAEDARGFAANAKRGEPGRLPCRVPRSRGCRQFSACRQESGTACLGVAVALNSPGAHGQVAGGGRHDRGGHGRDRWHGGTGHPGGDSAIESESLDGHQSGRARDGVVRRSWTIGGSRAALDPRMVAKVPCGCTALHGSQSTKPIHRLGCHGYACPGLVCQCWIWIPTAIGLGAPERHPKPRRRWGADASSRQAFNRGDGEPGAPRPLGLSVRVLHGLREGTAANPGSTCVRLQSWGQPGVLALSALFERPARPPREPSALDETAARPGLLGGASRRVPTRSRQSMSAAGLGRAPSAVCHSERPSRRERRAWGVESGLSNITTPGAHAPFAFMTRMESRGC